MLELIYGFLLIIPCKISCNLSYIILSLKMLQTFTYYNKYFAARWLPFIKSTRFQVNPSHSTEKTTKSSTQASGNHKSVVSDMDSIRNPNISLEGPKSIKRTPDLSSLKNLRTTFANKDLSNSTIQRQSSSLRNSEQNMKLPGNTTSNIALVVDGIEKQKLLTPSLKRKKFEVGLSGSGKSTLVYLLLRLFEPSNGQFFIDGFPLKELDIWWLRENIGFVGHVIHTIFI